MVPAETLLTPFKDENPTDFAERLGQEYASTVTNDHKKKIGQFFTPPEIADYMSSFAGEGKERLRILDPGCGTGTLSICLCVFIAKNLPQVREIDLVAFEVDLAIQPYSDAAYSYLRYWLTSKKILLNYFLCTNDFILHNSQALTNKTPDHDLYDIVISNPPYFKLPKKDPRVIATQTVIHGQTNIYSIFLLIAAKLLNNNGKLIFITPRSFCSGDYFKLFRKIFFSLVGIDLIHLFSSRKDAFKRDKVLQENIIIVAHKKLVTKKTSLKPKIKEVQSIIISRSDGLSDLRHATKKVFDLHTLVNLKSEQKILHLPISQTDEAILAFFKKWKNSFAKSGLSISTGPVVDFRNTKYIRARPHGDTVPLIWLHNIEKMKITWPYTKPVKGKKKWNYIQALPNSKSVLIPNKNYILLRRFSSKDDTKRLIAAPFFKNIAIHAKVIGIENHLNYIYKNSRELSLAQATGIAGILNSRLFDLYFRTFNGNINVSATEMRNIPLPNTKDIEKLGKQIIQEQKNNKTVDIDALMHNIFHINFNLDDNY